jgi:hypothetical protein
LLIGSLAALWAERAASVAALTGSSPSRSPSSESPTSAMVLPLISGTVQRSSVTM